MDADQLAEVPPSGPTDSPDAGAPMGRRRFLHAQGWVRAPSPSPVRVG
jgi:hypothetical protein